MSVAASGTTDGPEAVHEIIALELNAMNRTPGYFLTLVGLACAGTAYAQTGTNSALALNGTTDYVVSGTQLAVANTFTMELWVDPTAPHQIDAETAGGAESGVAGQHYAVYPLHGTACWGGGHAGVGISVGTNGVSIYEHAAEHMPAVLVYAGEISGWTHIAVVYRDRVPSLFINGRLVRTGVPSGMRYVHPSAGRAADRYVYGGIGGGPFGYFAGMIDDFRVWDRARPASEIRATMPLNSTAVGTGLLLAYGMNRSGEGTALSVSNMGSAATNGTTVGTNVTPRFVGVESATTQGSGMRIE